MITTTTTTGSPAGPDQERARRLVHPPVAQRDQPAPGPSGPGSRPRPGPPGDHLLRDRHLPGVARPRASAAPRRTSPTVGSPIPGYLRRCWRGGLHVSVRTLQRAFASAGEPAAAYIRHRRLEEARLALTAPSNRLSVTELAAYWQFADSSHFIRAFKKHYGRTPTEYTPRPGRAAPAGGDRNRNRFHLRQPSRATRPQRARSSRTWPRRSSQASEVFRRRAAAPG